MKKNFGGSVSSYGRRKSFGGGGKVQGSARMVSPEQSRLRVLENRERPEKMRLALNSPEALQLVKENPSYKPIWNANYQLTSLVSPIANYNYHTKSGRARTGTYTPRTIKFSDGVLVEDARYSIQESPYSGMNRPYARTLRRTYNDDSYNEMETDAYEQHRCDTKRIRYEMNSEGKTYGNQKTLPSGIGEWRTSGGQKYFVNFAANQNKRNNAANYIQRSSQSTIVRGQSSQQQRPTLLATKTKIQSSQPTRLFGSTKKKSRSMLQNIWNR